MSYSYSLLFRSAMAENGNHPNLIDELSLWIADVDGVQQ